MPRALAIVVFLILTVDSGLVHTPLVYVSDLLFTPSALKLPLWTYAQIGILLAYGGLGKKPLLRARPLDRALLGSVACFALWTLIGAVRGGNLTQAGFQTFELLGGVLLAFVLMAALKTPREYMRILDAVLAAAVFRAVAAILAYVFIARSLPWDKVPECMTSHHDSALFVTGIIILVAGAIEEVSRRSRSLALVLVPVLLVAVQVNNRRLAWVSLVGALLALFVALPGSRGKRRVRRVVAWAAPVLILYLAVGWGRSESIFKPLRAFASVTSRDDLSTRSRDNENEGLIYTLAQNGALGTGFGHEYIETDTSLSARAFTQYRFIPHNSLLAALAFTGMGGFAGIFLPIALSVFLNGRICRAPRVTPAARVAAAVGVAEVAICLNQMYGDMGFFSRTTLTILATALATAGRLSAWSGAWPTRAGPAKLGARPTSIDGPAKRSRDPGSIISPATTSAPARSVSRSREEALTR